jgi:hypothetical protein
MQFIQTPGALVFPSETVTGYDLVPLGQCPFLDAPDDPENDLSSSTEGSYCYQFRFPVPIGSLHRYNFCLTDRYDKCPVFRQSEATDSIRAEDIAVLPAGMPSSGSAEETSSIFLPVELYPALDEPEHPVTDIFDWPLSSEPEFPIFDPNLHVKVVPRRNRRKSRRKFLVFSLIFLGLLVIGWWTWLNLIALSGGGPMARSTIYRMPTVAPTADASLLGWIDSTGGNTPVITSVPSRPDMTTSPAENTGNGDEVSIGAIALTVTKLFAGATPAVCNPPAWWVRYIIQPGDSIEVLASLNGITVEELVRANCLGPDLLASVALLYLPPVGVIGASPVMITPTALNTNPIIAPLPTSPFILVPTSSPLQIPTLPPFSFPTEVPPSVIIISTQAPPVVAPTSPPSNPPPPPPPPAPPPAQPSLPTATPPAAPTPTSGPPPTATPPPLP